MTFLGVSTMIGKSVEWGGGHHLYITRMEPKKLAGGIEIFFDVRFF